MVDQRREEIFSSLDLLLKPAFRTGQIGKTNTFSQEGTNAVSSIKNKEKIVSLLFNLIPSKVLYPALSAQVLSDYIRGQMAASQKLKDLDFRLNLKTGVSQIVALLLKRFTSVTPIRGLRVVCSGR
jgi:hypothetical protein